MNTVNKLRKSYTQVDKVSLFIYPVLGICTYIRHPEQDLGLSTREESSPNLFDET